MYGWLRERFAVEMSRSQSGSGNSQYGTVWVKNYDKRKSIKIQKSLLDDYIAEGWVRGRVIDFGKYFTECNECSVEFFNPTGGKLYCCTECKPHPLRDREDEFISLFKIHKSKNKALKEMGLLGNVGTYSKWAGTLV